MTDVLGTPGNDSLKAYGGQEREIRVDGLDGIDTAVFPNAFATYAITLGSPSTVICKCHTVTLSNVERFAFEDTRLAVDMDGHAGTVVKLIAAVFGLACVGDKGYVGIGLGYADSGMTTAQLAGVAVMQPVFTQLAGSDTNEAFVRYVYQNVIGTQPGEEDLAYYTWLLDTGANTRADLAMLAADCSANAAQLAGVMQAGVEFA